MGSVLPQGQLSIGMQLPIQSQSTIYVEPWEATAGAAELAAVARAADAAGFAYVAVCDHVAIPAEQAPAMGTEWWDTVATLGWLAGITERVRLLSHVYVPAYRHPLQVAKAFSTLDVVSGGRVVLGVGAGHVEGEFEALGVPFAERGRLLDEAIDALRAAFAEDYPTLPGPRWPAADLGQHPRPVQEDGPPIWVGGSSPAAIRRAAERGDGWLPQGPVTAELVARIHELRHAAGRHDRFDLGALVGPTYVGDPGWDLGPPALTGSPDKLAHVLRKFAGLGVGQVQIRLRSRSADELVDQIGRFGAEVLPQLVLDA
ncbi:MAG TPA: TIGR03619 family F420-dependent LLM class oxidoreductase [Aquihabitans sp.]|jgi:probable F420-dependent oxidoreductase|nr:TIGR03619 family F420-dependent LLM class oxidoreductase [Aquihabitans sp.]